MDVLAAALAYAAKGIRVIPIAPGEKYPSGIEAWQTKATSDPDTIRSWFTGAYKGWGVGIATGKLRDSYLFVLDVDDREQFRGSDTLADLEAEHGLLPATVTVHTPSGGKHLYFRSNTNVRNDAGKRLGPGLDIRGEGGQVLAPPTLHPNGKPYLEDLEHGFNQPPAIAPDWLIQRLTVEPKIDRHQPHDLDGLRDDPNLPSTRYNATSDWHSLLTADGWRHAYQHNGTDYYTRPGKDRGISASVNHNGNDALIVFSTNAPIPPGGYTRFGYYAQTRHGGDWKKASAAYLGTNPTPTIATTHELLEQLINWQDFWNQDHKSEDWIAYPLIARGRQTALFAVSKEGKSYIALACTAALATGKPIFGRPPQPPAHVLYLDYEMTASDLMERLETLGYTNEDDLSHLHYALIPSLPPLNTYEGAAEVMKLVELTSAQVVVIDTTGRAVEGEENSADTYREFARTTGLSLKAAGVALLRTDHAGKDKGKTQGQRGSSAKNDDVDIVYHLQRDGHTIKLTRLFSRIGWAPTTVELIEEQLEDDHKPIRLKEELETFTEEHYELARRIMIALGLKPGDKQQNSQAFRRQARQAGIKARNDLWGPALRAIAQNRLRDPLA